ncbi:replication factor A protein 2 [Cladochytrium tenue]|nr:replication factor A protein 2 [Cladochytrium tenue]
MMGSTGYGGYNSNFGGGGGGFNNRNNNNFGGGGGGAFSNFNSYSAANNSPAGAGGGGYGGFGGGGGGTFSPSQTNSPGTGAKPRTSWSARPVTIKHLLTASQEVGGENALFELDGHEFSTAVVVGRVQRATSTSTFTSYIIEDGTGQIDIRKWVQKSNESDFDAAAEETYPVGVYLRVVGAMRPYQGKTYLQAHAIFPIQSVDEITYHILDAVYAHLYITRGGAPSAPQHNLNAAQSAAYASSAYAQKPGLGGGGGGGGGGDLGRVGQAIMELMNANKNLDVPEDHILHALRAIAPEHEIRSNLSSLDQEGYIFASSDQTGAMTYRSV